MKKSQYMQLANQLTKNYILSEKQKPIISKLFDYFNGTGELDQNKGILLYGGIGCGKSTIMRIFEILTEHTPKQFEIYSEREICGLFAENGIKGLNPVLKNKQINQYDVVNCEPQIICIDDVGLEIKTTKYYGTETNVIHDVLSDRYDMNVITHGTTNVITTMTKAYGERLTDRFKEMFNFVFLPGGSYRR